MGFDYDKITKRQTSHDSWWTSYADLLMIMSVIFLLLYVVASMRSGASSVQSQLDNHKLAQEAADLKEQIKVYSALKDDYLTTRASKEEQATYQELMKKLSLLKDEAREEKDQLRQQAAENEKKEEALNQYQQIIRNIINANMLAKAGLKSRDEVIATKRQQIEDKSEELAEARSQYTEDMKSLETKFDREMAEKKAAFAKELAKTKMTEADKARRQAAFRAQAEKEAFALKAKLVDMGGKIKGVESKLAAAEKTNEDFKAYSDGLQKDKARLTEDLRRSKAVLDAKRKVADQIAKNLGAAGVKAAVDGRTGDVELNFGDEYFDTGRSDLKPKMASILKQAMPAYAKGLFNDPKTASQIESVEIVGFASPTYKGKFVDPQSLAPEDRSAVSYNMDLSYQRARAIFQYIFDTDQMRFNQQHQLLPLVKVTGRSFLSDDIKGRDLKAGINIKEYCEQFDCKKSQRVIIKFDLKK